MTGLVLALAQFYLVKHAPKFGKVKHPVAIPDHDDLVKAFEILLKTSTQEERALASLAHTVGFNDLINNPLILNPQALEDPSPQMVLPHGPDDQNTRFPYGGLTAPKIRQKTVRHGVPIVNPAPTRRVSQPGVLDSTQPNSPEISLGNGTSSKVINEDVSSIVHDPDTSCSRKRENKVQRKSIRLYNAR
jgi:hypothetical protein